MLPAKRIELHSVSTTRLQLQATVGCVYVLSPSVGLQLISPSLAHRMLPQLIFYIPVSTCGVVLCVCVWITRFIT